MKLRLTRWHSIAYAEILSWRSDFRQAPLATALSFVGHVGFIVLPVLLILDPEYRADVLARLLDVLTFTER